MPRRKWSATKVASYLFTLLTLAAVVGMGTLFLIQSLPVWGHSGAGFIFGKEWFYRDGKFGAAPMIYGTVVVAGLALLLAAPLGTGAAIFISEFLPRRLRLIVKAAIELLAGIPSVVYGLLGILLLRDWIYEALESYEPLSGDTLLTAGILLAVMILPTVVTLADDALRGVPSSQRLAARGLGLNAGECVLYTVLPQAFPGIVAAVLLAAGRALGETIAVFLIVGRQDNQWPESLLSLKPLIEAGQTLTSKLGGSETNIAYGAPLHWGAMVGLGLILLALAVIITLLGVWLRHLSSRHAA
jgi:phosphate transport system permease protein